MSAYYDITRPFSIDNWNHLIQDINEILQNPPEGSTCEPITTLDEVSDPHKWSKEDVEKVRTALSQTCPEITFITDLLLWKAEIIDEIESQMESAWCDCESQEGPRTRIIPNVCIHGGDFDGSGCAGMSAGHSYQDDITYLCEPPYSKWDWSSTYYPDTSTLNTSLANTAFELADHAYDAFLLYQLAWDHMMAVVPDIKQKQSFVDMYAALVDANIALLEACDGDSICEAPYRVAICDYGAEAKNAQEELDPYVAYFQEQYFNMLENEEACDSYAQASIVPALSMQPRYPVDSNLVPEILSFLGGLAWKSHFKPIEDGKLRTVPVFGGSTPQQVIPKIVIKHGGSSWFNCVANDVLSILISPNGYPFIRTNPISLVTTTGVPVAAGTITYRCHQWEGLPCYDWVTGALMRPCNWMTIQDRYCVSSGFDDCIMNCSYERSTWSFDFYSAYEGAIYSTPSTKDYTEDQVQFLATYLGWYNEHPKYDDRHEAYC